MSANPVFGKISAKDSALVNKMSHIWREEGEGEKKSGGDRKVGLLVRVSVLKGFTTWTKNSRNETDRIATFFVW